jgi:gamma-glutamyltranspeptidase/glutathione hydrolase
VLGSNIVATSQPLASQAGIRMLLRGGNAVDAAVAAAICLTVVEPTMNGIGGDAFALVWDGEALHGLNASGRSPRAWTLEQFAGLREMPATGWGSVTVPGAVSSWITLSRRFGILPFADLFEPAIEYAESGFPVSPFIARTWKEAAEKYRGFDSFVATFLPHGAAPAPGEWVRLPEHARTLAEIAETYGESFYRGRLSRLIAEWSRLTGGLLDEDDLAGHAAEWVEPLSATCAGFTLHEFPPNSQGMAALLAVSLLREAPVVADSPDSVESIDLQVRAMWLAQEEVRRHVADPAFMDVDPHSLLEEEHVGVLRRALDCRSETRPPRGGMPREGDTVYLAAADADGMMVSFIQSNYYDFGSGIVVPGTGIALHSRAACFGLDPSHPNAVAGGKRPFHTLSPAFVTAQGRPVMSFGVMGGHMQPQGHVQMFVRSCLGGQNPQAACDAPRWHVGRDGGVLLEVGACEGVADALAGLGHRVQVVGFGDPLFGGAQAIRAMPQGYCAASDPRKDGQAAAL